tara:strand:- start:2773 stop:3615 length:843 start_codon:yes stop_codon:yes gene_type:complete
LNKREVEKRALDLGVAGGPGAGGMSFDSLGPDHYLIIYEMSRKWPAFWGACQATYRWACDHRRRDVARGIRKSAFLTSKFSDHVYDWDSYCKAIQITPPIHENRDLMSVALIKRLAKDGGETCVRVLNDMRCGAGMWITQCGLHFESYKRPDVQYWMFAAYEACVAGNVAAVHGCMDIAHRECTDGDSVVQMSLELLATVWNAHNDAKMGPTRGRRRLGFNDCIYNCVLHNDPVGIKAVIKTYDIYLVERNFYSRKNIRELAEMSGYELCKKVLRDYDFF